ncbi:MAG: hypothetical protein V4653_02710 [Pseudomonadota bacterium]
MPTNSTSGIVTGLAAILLAGGVAAQTAPAPATPTAPASPQTTAPAATAPRAADTQREGAPVAGANSFTERQAQARITDAGHSQVTGLSLGSDGVWRGRAMRNGVADDVAMDYRGEIFVGAQARAPASGTRADSATAPATAPAPATTPTR